MRNRVNAGIDHIADMRAFVCVADAHSFTAAAEHLGLSRSAIGKSIARLEDGLATRLLQRTTRNVMLTDDGQVFYEHAARILAEVDEAEAALAKRGGTPRGRLRLDLPVAFGRMHVMPILQKFLSAWPELEADVTFSDDYSDLVREGIDLAIRLGGNDDSRLIRKVLAPHRLVTCASPAYLARRGIPASLEDLVAHDTLVFTHGRLPVPWRYCVNGQERTIEVAGAIRLSCTQALRDAALAGAGLVQIGAFMVGEQIRNRSLVPVLESFTRAESPVCAVYPTRRHLSPKVRRFLDEIEKCWQGGAPWETWQ